MKPRKRTRAERRNRLRRTGQRKARRIADTLVVWRRFCEIDRRVRAYVDAIPRWTTERSVGEYVQTLIEHQRPTTADPDPEC